MKFADLHLHTFFSDGTYSPLELVEQSCKCDLSAIAVCDHDTVEGLVPCIAEASVKGLELLPGIELTSEYEGKEVHILGYLLDYRNKLLLDKLAALKKNRVERIYKIVEKLNEIGVNLKAEEVFRFSGQGTVGRLHVARALLKQGLVSSIFEAFYKYIGDKGPAYVLGFRFSSAEAITLIKEAKGIPVLAHPYVLNDDGLIPKFAELGVLGLETYYPEHSQSMVNLYLRLADKYSLLVTGGSDCHGNAKPQVNIGSIKVPYSLVEALKEARKKL